MIRTIMSKQKNILTFLLKAAGEKFSSMAADIKSTGGRVFFVGGCVRDFFLEQSIEDIDVEVYGVTAPQLEQILCQYGTVNHIGKSFGVYIVKGMSLDITLPRTEKKMGVGHKDFIVTVDPFLPLEMASKRRDFTWNAIYVDAISGEIIDPFNGLKDLQLGIVRHIDDKTFAEDPLRVLRALQFAGRFGFTLHADTKKLCRSLLSELPTLPKERLFEEFKKLLLKAPKPSLGLRLAQEIGVVNTLFPELQSLIGCPQSAKYHPEGDVWEHTLLVVDAAAKLRDKTKNPQTLMFAALCHDMGKPATTKVLHEGKIISHGHERAGVAPTRSFIQRLTRNKKLLQEVTILVKEHMNPYALYKTKASDSALKRLSRRVDVQELLLLAEADRQGRGNVAEDKEINGFKNWFEEKIIYLSLDKEIKPLIQGEDLIKMGIKRGPIYGKLLHQAFEMQLDGKSRADILKEIKRKTRA